MNRRTNCEACKSQINVEAVESFSKDEWQITEKNGQKEVKIPNIPFMTQLT